MLAFQLSETVSLLLLVKLSEEPNSYEDFHFVS